MDSCTLSQMGQTGQVAHSMESYPLNQKGRMGCNVESSALSRMFSWIRGTQCSVYRRPSSGGLQAV